MARAAGLADGMAGNSSAAATSGAIAGKNAVENNAVSGIDGFGSGFWDNKQAQGSLVNNTNLVDETGKVLNPATGLLTAWGSGATAVVVPVLLPSGATAGSIIGAGVIRGSANILNQLQSDDPFSATDALIATGVSGLTQGKGFLLTEVAGITGAYAGAKLQGKEALPIVAGAAFGTGVGAAGGRAVEVGNKYLPLISEKAAGLAGAVIGCGASEVAGSELQ